MLKIAWCLLFIDIDKTTTKGVLYVLKKYRHIYLWKYKWKVHQQRIVQNIKTSILEFQASKAMIYGNEELAIDTLTLLLGKHHEAITSDLKASIAVLDLLRINLWRCLWPAIICKYYFQNKDQIMREAINKQGNLQYKANLRVIYKDYPEVGVQRAKYQEVHLSTNRTSGPHYQIWGQKKIYLSGRC